MSACSTLIALGVALVSMGGVFFLWDELGNIRDRKLGDPIYYRVKMGDEFFDRLPNRTVLENPAGAHTVACFTARGGQRSVLNLDAPVRGITVSDIDGDVHEGNECVVATSSEDGDTQMLYVLSCDDILYSTQFHPKRDNEPWPYEIAARQQFRIRHLAVIQEDDRRLIAATYGCTYFPSVLVVYQPNPATRKLDEVGRLWHPGTLGPVFQIQSKLFIPGVNNSLELHPDDGPNVPRTSGHHCTVMVTDAQQFRANRLRIVPRPTPREEVSVENAAVWYGDPANCFQYWAMREKVEEFSEYRVAQGQMLIVTKSGLDIVFRPDGSTFDVLQSDAHAVSQGSSPRDALVRPDYLLQERAAFIRAGKLSAPHNLDRGEQGGAAP